MTPRDIRDHGAAASAQARRAEEDLHSAASAQEALDAGCAMDRARAEAAEIEASRAAVRLRG